MSLVSKITDIEHECVDPAHRSPSRLAPPLTAKPLTLRAIRCAQDLTHTDQQGDDGPPVWPACEAGKV